MYSVFPTPWTVWVHRFTSGGRNAHNVPVKAYYPPKDAVGEPIKAIQWEFSTSEPDVDKTVERATLYLPPVLRSPAGAVVALPKNSDLIDLPNGEQYEIVGIRNVNHGFHGWAPGFIIELQRATP